MILLGTILEVFSNKILDLLEAISIEPLSDSVLLNSVVDQLELYTTKLVWHYYYHPVNWALVPTFPFCQTIDLHDYFDLKNNTPKMIYVGVNKVNGARLSLHLEGRDLYTERELKDHYKSYTGLHLENWNLGEAQNIDALITLSQTINVERNLKDKNFKC